MYTAHHYCNSFVSSPLKSYNKKRVKRNAQTPKTHKEIEGENSLENRNECTEPEFSPSQSPSQFPSSQIPSTQDWEVVWDCNSPGYSKEELKKSKLLYILCDFVFNLFLKRFNANVHSL